MNEPIDGGNRKRIKNPLEFSKGFSICGLNDTDFKLFFGRFAVDY